MTVSFLGKLLWPMVLLIVLASPISMETYHFIWNETMRLISDDALAIATIWQEARGESYEGKLAVASVIRNRMNKKYSSDGTATGTVLRPLQFSGWNSYDPNRIPSTQIDDEDPVVKECIRAWKESAIKDITKGAVLYFNPKIVKRPRWAEPDKAVLVKVIGSHEFYVPKV